MKIDLRKKCIGIPSNYCFVCGEKATNRHHAIPKALNPKKNVTIPLCDKHKDVCHPIVKQIYFPKKLRKKVGIIKKHSDNLNASIASFKKELNFTEKGLRSSTHVSHMD